MFLHQFFTLSLLIVMLPMVSPLAAQSGWEDGALEFQYDSLLQLAETYPDDSLARKSWLLHEAGKIADDAKQQLAAIKVTEVALQLRLRDEERLSDAVLLSAMNLGIYNSNIDQYKEALRYFDMVTSRAPNRKEAVAWYQIGRVFGFTGQFAEGEQAFRRAAELPAFADSPFLTAYLQQQLGALNLRRHSAAGGEAAIPYLTKALRYFHDDGDDLGEMETRNFLGWAYTETGNYQQASRELDHAKKLALQQDEFETLSSVHSNLGMTFRRQGAVEEAIREYQRGLEILADLDEDPTATAPFLNNLSTATLEAGQPERALRYAQQCLEAVVPNYEAGSLFDLPETADITLDPIGVLIYLQDLARAHRAMATEVNAKEHAKAALEAFRAADDLLDQMRSNQLLEDTRTYWRADARSLYDEAIATALEAYDAESVFYFIEKSRARLLLDEVSAGRAEELLPENARARLSKSSREARLNPDSPGALRQFRQVQDSILSAFPEYARQRMGAEPPAPEKLSKILKGRHLIEYYVSGTATLALVSQPNGTLQLVKIAAAAEWEPSLWAYREQLATPNKNPDPTLSLQLYRQLIAPLNLLPDADLVIVPDGELYLLPFGTLLPELPTAGQALKDWPWLANNHTIGYAYSAQLLEMATSLHNRGNGRALALAPVAAMPQKDVRLELPATNRTVDHLFQLFPTDTLVNHSATRSAFREKADLYSLLHLGTHAYPTFGGSFLLRDDPALYTQKDLMNHRLKADLVVVGACETGLGEQIVGEGVASLGRGFARRGAPGLIMSLWSIDDAATADLLNHTYDHLAAGVGPATALQKAGTAFRESSTNPRLGHPYFWAGLVHFGQNTPLPMARGKTRWPFYLFGAITLVFVLGGTLRRKK